jgi:hypothetical protein
MRKHYIDSDFDSSLENMESHFVWRTRQKQGLKNRILTDIEMLEIQAQNKTTIESSPNHSVSLPRKLVYSAIGFTLLFSLLIGSTFISPAMAEVMSRLPFLGSLNHNVVQLQKNPGQIGAYLDLVSAYNKGDLETYLQTYSRELSTDSKERLEKGFKTRGKEKHQIAAKLDLVYSNKNVSILLSNEKHAFDSEVLYSLDSYVILNKENGSWKVLEKLPLKKVGKGKYGSHDDFDHTAEIRHELEKTYHLNLK